MSCNIHKINNSSDHDTIPIPYMVIIQRKKHTLMIKTEV